MSYISEQKFKILYGHTYVDNLIIKHGVSAASGSLKLQQILDDESATIDGYLQARGLETPISGNAYLEGVCGRWAMFTLMHTIGEDMKPSFIAEKTRDEQQLQFGVLPFHIPGTDESSKTGLGGFALPESGSDGSSGNRFGRLWGTFL